jgi:D-galactose 1-dehydrogenase
VTAIDVAIVGVGKIARDQHVPAIATSDRFRLAATVSRSGGIEGVDNHPDVAAFLAAHPDVAAVSLCMPPLARFAAAEAAIGAGRHVMLEKPPGAGVAEVLTLERMARDNRVTLFATWHSRHAAAVGPARDWLAGRRVRRTRIEWKEDVRKWHPGQDWIWEPGGLGVFDPGINALSILTAILPMPIRLTSSVLHVPANRQAPIAAELEFAAKGGVTASASFDWRREGDEIWDIVVETDDGVLRLSQGGARLFLEDEEREVPARQEYPDLYRRFAQLIDGGESDVDAEPLVHVADAFMLGRRTQVEPFEG